MDPNSIAASTSMPVPTSDLQSTANESGATMTPTTENKELDVVFVDATFSFLPLPENDNHITVAFGAMLRRRQTKNVTNKNHDKSNDTYFYIKGPAVTQRFLHDHMDQHDTVLEETKSFVIAKHVALALRQLQPNKSVRAKANIIHPTSDASFNNNNNDNNPSNQESAAGLRQVDIPLLYEDGAETSLLRIVHSSSGTYASKPLDESVASTWLNGLLYQNMAAKKDDNLHDASKTPPSWKLVGTTDDAKELLGVFEEWKQFHVNEYARQESAASQGTNGEDSRNDDKGTAAASPAKSQPTTHNVSQSSPPGKASNKNKPKVVRPRPMGMRVGGMKKKKAKTKNKFSSAGSK